MVQQGGAMKPVLVLLHGWGFDASIWDGLAACLLEFTLIRWDRGYFGSPAAQEVPASPVAMVGHSLGAMLLSRMWPDVPLVAVNGFDRFCGADAVAPRVLARMRKRFAEADEEVLADFRARLAAGEAPAIVPAIVDAAALGRDLALLAGETPPMPRKAPVLVLHGDADPLLPETMRAATFAGARRECLAGGGHLLPVTAPEWCASHIRAFLG